jgi:GNAT superfamily N-acetyltransferase
VTEARIRGPRPDDAPAITALLGQLGHPAADAADVPRRVAAILRHPEAKMWVAELDGRPVGFATALVITAIHMDGPIAQLTSLVVDEAVRGRGVGARLVAEAEAWAVARGAVRISLTSALHRAPAHAFYEHLGYAKTGVRLAKDLG